MKQRFAGMLDGSKKKNGIVLALLCAFLMVLCGACGVNEAPPATDKSALESQWAAATYELRKALEVPAFAEADALYYVESANGQDLDVHAIYRAVDESGGLLPEIMFSDQDEPLEKVVPASDVSVETLSVQQGSAQAQSGQGALTDVIPGSVVSVWGAFNQDGDSFTADRIVVWVVESSR